VEIRAEVGDRQRFARAGSFVAGPTVAGVRSGRLRPVSLCRAARRQMELRLPPEGRGRRAAGRLRVPLLRDRRRLGNHASVAGRAAPAGLVEFRGRAGCRSE